MSKLDEVLDSLGALVEEKSKVHPEVAAARSKVDSEPYVEAHWQKLLDKGKQHGHDIEIHPHDKAEHKMTLDRIDGNQMFVRHCSKKNPYGCGPFLIPRFGPVFSNFIHTPRAGSGVTGTPTPAGGNPGFAGATVAGGPSGGGMGSGGSAGGGGGGAGGGAGGGGGGGM